LKSTGNAFQFVPFVLVFLPVTLGLYLLMRPLSDRRYLIAALLLASLVFYACWDWRFLPVLLGSMIVNYGFGLRLNRARTPPARRIWLGLGIALNLGLLFVFKYAAFAVASLAAATGWPLSLGATIVLPIGISFFTFQQIAYLVDIERGEAVTPDPLRYGLFVTFFPHFIAGPIVHHREFIPQLPDLDRRPFLPDLAVGLTIFTIGLAKKVLLADNFALVASPVFNGAAAGQAPTLATAWAGVIAYALQIYFDFSAYSDMAIGLARMFGIVLPINFAAPYKATSIIDFWHRWHITLSRFLRHYLYIPLGGNRRGAGRRQLNIFVTMLLGGIWHGAGWTFALWGAIHGVLIVGNHLWRRCRFYRPIPAGIAWPLTILAVFVAWVPFRAADVATTSRMLAGLIGLNGLSDGRTFDAFPNLALLLGAQLPAIAWPPVIIAAALICGLWLAATGPTTQALFRNLQPGLTTQGYQTGLEPAPPALPRLDWRPTAGAAMALGALFAACLLKLNDVSEFIYFQF
jgi:D-alanyl-lipoteichoic acid acyltransferase DltB (MBOAT superfamily)